MEGNGEVATSEPLGESACENNERARGDKGSNVSKISGNDGEERVCNGIMDNGCPNSNIEKPSYNAMLTKDSMPNYPATTWFDSRFDNFVVVRALM